MTSVLGALAAAAAVLALPPARPPARTRLRALVGDARSLDGGRRRTPVVALAVVAVGCTALVVSPVVVLLGVPAVTAAGWALRQARRRRETEQVTAAAVDVVYALAAELRAGRPPGAALAAAAATAGPLSRPLTDAALTAASGEDATAQLQVLSAMPGCGALAAVAAAWEVTARVGGPVADVLDRLGQALDEEEQNRRALAAALAGPRTTMMMLAALPLGGVALGESVGAHPVRLLLHRPLGWGLLAAAAVLDAVGVAWTRGLTRLVSRP